MNALEPFQKGRISVDGVSVGDSKTNLPKLRARIGMVFQNFELFPHMTVTRNLTLAQMKVLGRGEEEARAKGLKEMSNVLRYPPRIAINPLLSTLGWMLPAVVGGEIVVSKVLNLPTIGPVLLEASITQDMYLAGAIVMILSVLTVLGTFISDILLALNDPRIRME